MTPKEALEKIKNYLKKDRIYTAGGVEYEFQKEIEVLEKELKNKHFNSVSLTGVLVNKPVNICENISSFCLKLENSFTVGCVCDKEINAEEGDLIVVKGSLRPNGDIFVFEFWLLAKDDE